MGLWSYGPRPRVGGSMHLAPSPFGSYALGLGTLGLALSGPLDLTHLSPPWPPLGQLRR